MNSQRITMAGWTESRAETLSTADESQQQLEITIEQHLENQRSAREEQQPGPKRKSVRFDGSEKTPSRNKKKKSGRCIMIVLGVMVVVCAGLAVGFHFYNQSVLDDKQENSAAAISTSEGDETTIEIEDDTDAPSVSVAPQAPTTSPTEATPTISPTQTTPTISPTTSPSASPTLTTIVVDAPLSTDTPSTAPTPQGTLAPNLDATIDTPLTPSTMPAVTTNPSLRPSLRPNTSNTIVPSVAPTIAATNIATNQLATLNPTVPPTMVSTAKERFDSVPTVTPRSSELPTVNPTEEPTVEASLGPTPTPSLRGSSTPTNTQTVTPTTSRPTDSPTQEDSFAPTTTSPSDSPTQKDSFGPTTTSPSDSPTREDSSVPTPSPTTLPPTDTPTTSPPTDSPTSQPTPAITLPPTNDEFSRVVIEPDRRLNQGDYVFSPNGRYRVGLTNIGDLELVDTATDELIWNANITGGYRCFMQGDGNCIIRDENGQGLWSTKTSKNYDSQLVLDNGGMLGILYNSSYLWIQGVPRETFDDSTIGVPSANDIQFPIRGAFYYPWYPETWRAGGEMAIFEPSPPLGYYNSADPAVVDAHLDHFEYGNIELGILSWWGQSRNNDRARISLIQNMTQARGSNIKWAAYYEEMHKTKTVEEVTSDLAYLKKWFTWHDTWAKVDGKPVIFVYHNRGCQNAERWMEAANGEWHVVLKLFGGFEACPIQPSSWHNYGPAKEVLSYEGHSFSISPGFWHAAESEPRLPRVNQTRWCEMVQNMVDSQAPWQLITTFNEAGEGTMIEPSAAWASDSGYGYYLDCLHEIS